MDQVPSEGSADQHGGATEDAGGEMATRREWIQANFTQIFGRSVDELRGQGIDPRRYAREHRDQIRSFARMQRSRGIVVPDGRPSDGNGPRRSYGGGGVGGRSGRGMWGGGTWVGMLLALFALRFLLVDSFAGGHAAIFWVLGVGGILLVVRVFLFTWLRKRRRGRRQEL